MKGKYTAIIDICRKIMINTKKLLLDNTAQKMKFSIKDFFNKRTCSINVTKSTGNCEFGHIY